LENLDDIDDDDDDDNMDINRTLENIRESIKAPAIDRLGYYVLKQHKI